MSDIYLPYELKRIIDGQPYILNDIGMSDAKVLIFEDKVLKIQPSTLETQTEHTMMTWLENKLPVPKCLYHMVEEGTNYLLMSKLKGKMACDEECLKSPKELVSILAEGLKMLWEINISDCNVKWNLERKLIAAKSAVDNGEVDIENTEPETFGENGFNSPSELLDWLQKNQPNEDLVLSHGDFCLPNVFIKDGKVAGFIDLGRMGIADRWQDIALCYRSLMHNYGGKYSGKAYKDHDPNLLFEALEMEPNWQKLRYYILMDELF